MCTSCRSRTELSNEYLLAKIGFDTAENGPLKVCQKLANSYKKVQNKHRPEQFVQWSYVRRAFDKTFRCLCNVAGYLSRARAAGCNDLKRTIGVGAFLNCDR